jgi:hypothetical protein
MTNDLKEKETGLRMTLRKVVLSKTGRKFSSLKKSG